MEQDAGSRVKEETEEEETEETLTFTGELVNGIDRRSRFTGETGQRRLFEKHGMGATVV